eukprot:3288206-Pyramimonas_sp.AAC.1
MGPLGPHHRGATFSTFVFTRVELGEKAVQAGIDPLHLDGLVGFPSVAHNDAWTGKRPTASLARAWDASGGEAS